MTVATDLTTHVVGFCRALRARGLTAGPREAADGLRALAAINVGSRRECYLALRTVLTSRHEDLPVFDEVFDAYWNPPTANNEGEESAPPQLAGLSGDGQLKTPTLLEWLDEALQPQGEEALPAYSPSQPPPRRRDRRPILPSAEDSQDTRRVVGGCQRLDGPV